MTHRQWQTLDWKGDLSAALIGVLLPLSLAPYRHWALGMVAAAALAYLLQGVSARQGLLRAWLFGLGMYGSGASWVYVSIHDFGYTAAPLALVLTALFVFGLALVFALPFYAYCRWFNRGRAGFAWGFPAVWVLGEWLRSWFLTGFPWLYLGYGHIDTWLAGWAPLLGVFGLSFIAVASATLITELLYELVYLANHRRWLTPRRAAVYLVALAGAWLGGAQVLDYSWHTREGRSLQVALVQPNIPLELKWNPLYRGAILATLREETEAHWGKDIIVWPEAAVPTLYHDSGEFLGEIDNLASANNTGLLTGILYDDAQPGVYYNSIVGLGRASGTYFKQRLVPFGEYVPLERWLRGLIAFFNLPNSIIYPGPKTQDILHLGGFGIAPLICYEIVYPDLVARLGREAELLVTISNDAWFGDSIGPPQHFQMARMRALENHRYLLRATNTGLSGVIDARGRVLVTSRQFEQQTISAEVRRVQGLTPFARWGSSPIVALCGLIVLALSLALVYKRQRLLSAIPG